MHVQPSQSYGTLHVATHTYVHVRALCHVGRTNYMQNPGQPAQKGVVISSLVIRNASATMQGKHYESDTEAQYISPLKNAHS